MLIALRIIVAKKRIEMARSGTINVCLSTRPGKEQQRNVKRGRYIQKAAKCVTSLHCAAGTNTPRGLRVFFLNFIEPF